jgi:hypothetical protein
MNNDENEIAVIPYVVYDALMERFERTQKNLRFACIGSVLLAVSLIISLLFGIGGKNGNCKNT